jgi:hypothetical protein
MITRTLTLFVLFLSACTSVHTATCVKVATDPSDGWYAELVVCYDESNGRCYAFSLQDGAKNEMIGRVPCDDGKEELIIGG